MKTTPCLQLVALVIAVGPLASPTVAAPIPRPRLAWITDGIPVCSAPNDQQRPTVIPNVSGGAFIAWIDGRVGLHNTISYLEVYAQHLTSQGEAAPGWPAGGILLSEQPQQDHIVMRPDNGGGLFIAWDSRSPYGTLTLKRVAASSAVLSRWSVVGTEVPAEPEAARFGSRPPDVISISASSGSPATLKPHRGHSLPSLIATDAGGVFVAWKVDDSHFGASVASQRLRTGFTVDPLWPTPYAELCGGWSYPAVPATGSDGQGGSFVTWADWADTTTRADIRMIHLGPNDVPPGWPFPGIVVCDAVGDQMTPGVCPDGEGGAFVVWQDARSGIGEQTRIQRILANGSVAPGWPSEGIVLSPHLTSASAVGYEQYYGTISAIISDGSGGAIVAWIDHRDGTVGQFGRVCLQRVTESGTIAQGWTLGGFPVTDTAELQAFPLLALDGFGGVIIAWQQMSAQGDWDIYAQRVELSAGPSGSWGPDAVPVCVQPGDQTAPAVASLVGGGVMIVWEDQRSGESDIYAAKVGLDGVVPVLISLVRAEVEIGGVRLEWYASQSSALRLAVERRIEQDDWRVLATISPDGNGHLVYEDNEVVAGGRYGYRLSYVEAGERQTTDETWVEVPAAPALALAVRPTPSVGPLAVSFTLASAEPAALEMFDLGGRRVFEAEVGGLGPGSHVMTLDRVGALAPGVYLMRLRQGGSAVITRGVVAR